MVLQTKRYPGDYQEQSYSTYQGPTGGYSNYQVVSDYASPHLGPYQASTYPSGYGPHHPSGWCSDDDYYGSGVGHYAGGRMPAPVRPKFDGYGTSYYENAYKHESSFNHGHGSPNHHGHGSPNHHGHGHGSPNHHGHGHGSPNHHGHGHGSPNHHGHGHGSPYNHGHGHGSPYNHGHDSPKHHGHDSPHHQSHGGSIDFGGAITNQINKLKPGHNNYENPYVHENSHHYGHGGSYNQGHNGPTGYGKTLGFGSAIKNQINKLTDGHNNYGSGSPNYEHGPSGDNHGYKQHTWVQKGLKDDE